MQSTSQVITQPASQSTIGATESHWKRRHVHRTAQECDASKTSPTSLTSRSKRSTLGTFQKGPVRITRKIAARYFSFAQHWKLVVWSDWRNAMYFCSLAHPSGTCVFTTDNVTPRFPRVPGLQHLDDFEVGVISRQSQLHQPVDHVFWAPKDIFLSHDDDARRFAAWCEMAVQVTADVCKPDVDGAGEMQGPRRVVVPGLVGLQRQKNIIESTTESIEQPILRACVNEIRSFA